MSQRRVWDNDIQPDKSRSARIGGQDIRLTPVVHLDDCPPGYDEDIWSMALLFEQEATRRATRLVHGRIILYAMLEPRMSWLRDQRASIDETRRGSWSADGETRFSTWQDMARVAIIRFWRDSGDILAPNDPGPYAASEFCHPLEFPLIIDEVIRKSVNKHAREVNGF